MVETHKTNASFQKPCVGIAQQARKNLRLIRFLMEHHSKDLEPAAIFSSRLETQLKNVVNEAEQVATHLAPLDEMLSEAETRGVDSARNEDA